MLVLKGETIPRTANVLRAFSPVSYGRAETTVERENARMEQENATRISADLKGRAKTVDRERTRENTIKTRSVSAGLKERATTVERERKKHATQGGEATGLA